MAAGINDTFRQVGIAVGIAVWGALFTAHGASRVSELAPATHGQGRQLVEAVSAGRLHEAVAQFPAVAAAAASHAAREGFLSGLNEVLVLGGIVSLLGAVAAALLVREREIEREPAAAEPEVAAVAVAA
jgi:hypothetical protein